MAGKREKEQENDKIVEIINLIFILIIFLLSFKQSTLALLSCHSHTFHFTPPLLLLHALPFFMCTFSDFGFAFGTEEVEKSICRRRQHDTPYFEICKIFFSRQSWLDLTCYRRRPEEKSKLVHTEELNVDDERCLTLFSYASMALW